MTLTKSNVINSIKIGIAIIIIIVSAITLFYNIGKVIDETNKFSRSNDSYMSKNHALWVRIFKGNSETTSKIAHTEAVLSVIFMTTSIMYLYEFFDHLEQEAHNEQNE